MKLEPHPDILERVQYREPHRRGEILVAATMRSFVEAWARRFDAPDEAKTEFVELRRVVEEGADVAATLLTMAIRALDYTPPVHLEFGDFLSAMLTADAEIRADDERYGLRRGLLDWYGRFGIAPASGTEDGTWNASDLQLARGGTRFGSLQTDPVEMFRLAWANRDNLHLTPNAYSRIASLRPCVRTSPDDGLPLRETVAECLQYVKIRASELGRYGLEKPLGMANDTEIELEGGSTLILDDYGRLKYEVHKRLPDPESERWPREGAAAPGVPVAAGALREGRIVRRPPGDDAPAPRRRAVRRPNGGVVMRQAPASLRIRSYNVGFGDCFLLTFSYDGGERRDVLIDFGSTKASRLRAAGRHAPRSRDKIAEDCGGKLDGRGGDAPPRRPHLGLRRRGREGHRVARTGAGRPAVDGGPEARAGRPARRGRGSRAAAARALAARLDSIQAVAAVREGDGQAVRAFAVGARRPSASSWRSSARPTSRTRPRCAT